jgi:uncharacterized membrane-anchored protein YhcB (DUF1043 family)
MKHKTLKSTVASFGKKAFGSMELTKQLFVGMIIGLLIGSTIVYGLAQFASLQNQLNQLQANNSELASLQTQVNQLQNENAQLAANNTALMNQLQQYQSGGNGATSSRNTSTNSQTEKLQFISAYANVGESTFNITMALQNTGKTVATIEVIFLNGEALSYFNSDIIYGFDTAIIPPGATVNGNIYLPIGTAWRSGMEIDVTIQTIAGNQYSKAISLP